MFFQSTESLQYILQNFLKKRSPDESSENREKPRISSKKENKNKSAAKIRVKTGSGEKWRESRVSEGVRETN